MGHKGIEDVLDKLKTGIMLYKISKYKTNMFSISTEFKKKTSETIKTLKITWIKKKWNMFQEANGRMMPERANEWSNCMTAT
jgi:hypothetical protein